VEGTIRDQQGDWQPRSQGPLSSYLEKVFLEVGRERTLGTRLGDWEVVKSRRV